jgi:hypothetical protein
MMTVLFLTQIVRAAPVNVPIHVDGRLTEPAWALAEPATTFTQLDPSEGAAASELTEVRILLGRHALYVGARLADRTPDRITARLARRDAKAESDWFEFQLDPYHDHRTAVAFAITPAGALRDALILPDGSRDDSWDPVWEAAAVVDSLGWTIEARVSLSQLRYRAGATSEWGIQLVRRISRRQETAVFAFVPKSEQGGVSRFGHLTGVEGLAAPRRLELLPHALARVERRSVSKSSASAGLDLRLGVWGDLTLAGTVNPDFGQVEVDPAVVNLTAFETFYPERRPFFIEGSDVFRFGESRADRPFDFSRPFHSRRIGRPPQRVLDGEASADAPAETTIDGAVKLTGRPAEGWAVGLVDAITGPENAGYLDGFGARQRATVEPLTNFTIARVRREFAGGATTVGALVTAVHRNLADSALSALLHRAAWVGGADLTHAWANHAWQLDVSLLASHLTGTPRAVLRAQEAPARYLQRPDAKGLGVDSTRTTLSGWVAQAGLAKTAGAHWLGSVAYQEASPGFENNDAGFVRRVNVRSATATATYKEDRPGRLLRRYSLTARTNQTWNFDGARTFSVVSVSARGQFDNYWDLTLELEYFPNFQDDRASRGGPMVLVPDGPGTRIEFSSDPRRTWSLGGSAYRNGIVGDVYHEGSATLFVRVRPSPTLEVQVEPAAQRNTLTYQYVTAIPDAYNTRTFGTRYVFARLEQTELAVITRADWTITPSLSLQFFVQPLVSAGSYHDFKELRAPGSFTFEVYGRDAGTIVLDPVTAELVVDPDGAGPAAMFRFEDPTFNLRSLRGNAVVRWEFHPGSTLFLVWQQQREDFAPVGTFAFGRDYGALFRAPAENVFHFKIAYWLGQ